MYDGALDPSERVLTLECEGPSMAGPGKTARHRDVIEVRSDDHRVLTSHMQGDDGEWHQFMTSHYRGGRHEISCDGPAWRKTATGLGIPSEVVEHLGSRERAAVGVTI